MICIKDDSFPSRSLQVRVLAPRDLGCLSDSSLASALYFLSLHARVPTSRSMVERLVPGGVHVGERKYPIVAATKAPQHFNFPQAQVQTPRSLYGRWKHELVQKIVQKKQKEVAMKATR